MENKQCPRCKDGKLAEKVFYKIEFGDNPVNLPLSGLFPVLKDIKYIEYSCSNSCGYKKVTREG